MRRFIYPEKGFIESDRVEAGCWIKVVCPTTEDLDFLVDDIAIPDSFLADIADTDERPRIEEEDGWELTIIRIPVAVSDSPTPYTTIPVGVIYSPERHITVTVCYRRTQLMPDFIDHCKRKKVSVTNEVDFIFRLVHSSAVWFLKYLKQISSLIMEAEEALESSIRNEDLLQLMKLQKCFVYFSTSIRGNEAVINKLQAIRRSIPYDEDLAEDVRIELSQAYNTVTIHSEILTGTMDAFASVISNNVNTIMKRMTSISIILMLPTLIASMYGMNVPNGWETKAWAFWLIFVVAIGLSAGAFVLLKRIKWF
ncbi:magnesium transporter CorA [Porphyromonas gingivicanis]|uniref:Magnesium transporter CorA n=1 Tax=Porphyromonas gingivicanis TaxID=266762 RepID=A0A0A2G4B5_9PORP|nr:magnesium transporter CorA family protein [Porphyromonas gingivicanis]KGN98086.1 magnesium transporter CorA [Porphyromonas gingivicanis]